MSQKSDHEREREATSAAVHIIINILLVASLFTTLNTHTNDLMRSYESVSVFFFAIIPVIVLALQVVERMFQVVCEFE